MTTDPPTPSPTRWPPKGLSFEFRSGKTLPYLARWRNGGVKQSKAFPDTVERDKFTREWQKKRKAKGVSVTIVTPQRAAVWAQFAELTSDRDPIEVARFWAKHHQTLGGAITLERAIEKYEAAQEGRRLSPDTVTHRDLHLKRLVGAVGAATKVGAITSETLRAWLSGLGMAAASQRHHRANAHKLFDWLVAERLADRNPVSAIPVPESEDDEINVMTVEQARHLFAVNRGHRSVARLALEAFAGLRFTSAARLAKADLKTEQKGIEMPGAKHKTGRRQFIDGLPACAWLWIGMATDETWTVLPRLYAEDKRTMFEAAGLKSGEGKDDEAMRNVLRHSFASYHVAAYRDPGKTAMILTHRNQQMLWAYYKGRATQADGRAYFGIAP